MRYLLPLCLCLLTSPLPGVAQNDDSNRTCRILFLSPSSDGPEMLYLYDGFESIEVALPRMNLSKVHKLRPGPLTLKLLKQPVTDPRLVPADAPSVKVAENLNHIYLLVTGDQTNKVAPVRMSVVNADHTRIGKGEMLWFNLTDKNIGGAIGTRKLQMRPKDSVVIKSPANDRESYPVEIFYNLPGKSEIHPLCETVWRHDPRSRSLIFLVEDKNRRVPRILSFNDFRG